MLTIQGGHVVKLNIFPSSCAGELFVLLGWCQLRILLAEDFGLVCDAL